MFNLAVPCPIMSTKTAHADFNTRNGNYAHAPHVTAPHSQRPSTSPPTSDPQSRSDQNNAAQPPFVGSASAEPPSECELERPNESELENQSAGEQCIDLENETPPDDRAIIAAHDPARLLHALAVLDFSSTALASELSVSPFTLLDWLESEETQRQLTRCQTIERQMLDLRALRSRRLTIESLEHVLETTQDLVEKRRTATTLLRLLTRTDHKPRTKTKSMAAQPPFHGSAKAEPPSNSEPQEKRGSESQEERAGESQEKCESKLREMCDSQSQQESAPERTAQTSSKRANQSESARGSDHTQERHDQTDANPAAQPRFVGSANAEPPSVSEQQDVCVSKPQDVCAVACETSDQQQPTTDQPRTTELDWDAFFPGAFTGADRTPPTPHQRE